MIPAPDFHTLFESIPGPYAVLLPDLQIVAATDAYLQATMTRREDILGRAFFDVFPDNPLDPAGTGVRNLKASLKRVVQTRLPDAVAVQKYDIRRPDSEGGRFEVRYWSVLNSPVPGPGGKVAYIIHRIEDVTDFVYLKQAAPDPDNVAEVLRTRAEQMEAEIFHRAREVAQANRQLRTANEELARLYSQIALLMAQAGDEFQVKIAEEESARAANTLAPEEMLARIGRLIAGHRRLEEKLLQSQKLEAIGRLAGGVAHDFNNLLTVITGYAALVQDQLTEAETKLHVEEILRAGKRAAELTGQLLAFSRKQVLQPRVVDLNAVVTGMEGLLLRLIGENISFGTVLASGLGKVKTDPSQFELVIMNLAVNARDAMPAGGRLIIETANAEVGPDMDSRLRPGSYVVLSVKDTGHGMDAETEARIFEPFFTTKERGQGTGLGLSTAFGIVEQSGGAILVHSEVNRGSVFRVYLPVTDAASAREPVERRAAVTSRRTGTVMVVEDEAPLRRLVCTILAGADYKVAEAANAQEALSLAMQYRDRIDVLLTDVVMPGMSGPELAERLRRTRPELTIVYMSGYDENLLQKPSPEGALFLPKPFTPDALLARMTEVMGQRSDEGAAMPLPRADRRG